LVEGAAQIPSILASAHVAGDMPSPDEACEKHINLSVQSDCAESALALENKFYQAKVS
jgi:hypothetical protein